MEEIPRGRKDYTSPQRLKLLERMDTGWDDMMSYFGFAIMVIALGALGVVGIVWWVKQVVDWN